MLYIYIYIGSTEEELLVRAVDIAQGWVASNRPRAIISADLVDKLREVTCCTEQTDPDVYIHICIDIRHIYDYVCAYNAARYKIVLYVIQFEYIFLILTIVCSCSTVLLLFKLR